VENFKRYIPFSSWPNCELRVERNTHRILDLLDSQRSAVSGQPSVSRDRMTPTNTKFSTPNPELNNTYKPSAMSHELGCYSNPKGTFFVLGWIAERLPHLVREIHSRGHEVASHGYYHKLCNREPLDTLKKDLADSKKLLEDIIGATIYGYRAPSFSINADILNVIETCGYFYDSSFNSFGMHGRYGNVDISGNGRIGIASQVSDSFYELPISNVELANCVLPWGGGAYFRVIPSPIFTAGVKAILRKQNAYLLYLHPWEFDPDQPKVKDAPMFYRLRHYVNLDKTYLRLSRVIRRFQHCRFLTCTRYIREMAS
jgi:polysaccharide deacetylase family protein (PEP-CTERM system associated)